MIERACSSIDAATRRQDLWALACLDDLLCGQGEGAGWQLPRLRVTAGAAGAGDRATDHRVAVTALGNGLLLEILDSGFFGREEGRSHPGTLGTEHEDRCHSAPVADAAGTQHRDPVPHGVDHLGFQTDDVAELAELKARAESADMALLDEFSLVDLRAAVALNRSHAHGPIKLEASGSVTLETLRAVGETGVDFISVGALTHSARTLDLGLDF